MMKFFRGVFEIIRVVVAIAVVIFFIGAFLKLILEPLAPIITMLIILAFTFLTFVTRKTAAMSVGGIALYAASWFALSAWGVWPAVFICVFGFLLWLSAVYKSFVIYMPRATDAGILDRHVAQ